MRTPVLNVKLAVPGRYDGRYYHIYVDVEVHDNDNDGDAVSRPTTAYGSDTEFYRVHVTSQTHDEQLGSPAATNTMDPFYGLHIQWCGGDGDLRTYEEGVKVLRKIDRHMERLQKSAGVPKSFGEFVLRLGRAMHINRAYVSRPDNLNPYVDLDYASLLIDRQIGAWMAKCRPNHTAATDVA